MALKSFLVFNHVLGIDEGRNTENEVALIHQPQCKSKQFTLWAFHVNEHSQFSNLLMLGIEQANFVYQVAKEDGHEDHKLENHYGTRIKD